MGFLQKISSSERGVLNILSKTSVVSRCKVLVFHGGILVALEGAFATGGQDGVRNVELALKQINNTIAGKKVETVVAPTDTKPDTTIRMARKLIEQDKVDLIIGPLSGSEGIAMRDFAAGGGDHDHQRDDRQRGAKGVGGHVGHFFRMAFAQRGAGLGFGALQEGIIGRLGLLSSRRMMRLSALGSVDRGWLVDRISTAKERERRESERQ